MNKLITKIVGAALGLTMAVGVGVVAGANFENSMEAVPVRAAEGDTHDMGVTFSSLLNYGASIDDVNIEAQSYTVEKVTLNVKYNKTTNPAVTIECFVGGTSWGTSVVGGDTYSKAKDIEFTGTATQGAVKLTFTNHCSGSKQGTFYLNSVVLTEGPAPHINVTSVTVDPTETTLIPGGTYSLSEHVTVLPANATDSSVTYAVTESEPVGCVTVDSNGLITAVEDGLAEVTVTSVDNSSKFAVFSVEVATPSEPTIVLNESSLEGFVGGNSSLTADYVALAGTGVTWTQSSTDGGSVTLGTPDTSISGKSTIAVTYANAGTVTIKAQDNGGATFAECSVVISKTLTGAIYAQTVTNENSVMNFTAKCNGSGTAGDGAEWIVTSDGTESNFDTTSGIHYGTNSASVTYVELSTSDVSGTIKQVIVNARDAQANATVSVTVGGKAFSSTGSTTATDTSSDFTFTGNGSGEVVVRVARSSSQTKALYVKTVTVTYEKVTTGEDIKNTNVLAQKAVIEFAEDLTSKLNAVCDQVNGNTDTTELDAKWTLIKGTFDSKRNSLDSDHQVVFDSLIKFATEDKNGDALQKALSSYKYVVGKYKDSLTEGDFLNSVSGRDAVQASSSRIGELINLGSNESIVAIIVITSLVSITAIGGYFFIRKRKEQ